MVKFVSRDIYIFTDIDHFHLVDILKLPLCFAGIFHMKPHPIIHMVRTKYCIVILDTTLSYTRLSRYTPGENKLVDPLCQRL